MPRALLHDPSRGRWLAFGTPRAEYRSTDPASLPDLLQAVCGAPGDSWTAGMLSYESASAFDRSCRTHPPGGFPAAWFALFDPPEILSSLPPPTGEPPPDAPWRADLDADTYAAAIHRIRDLIAAGDTYQVNYTFRLTREFPGDPYAFFHALAAHETPPFGAFLDLGSHAVCSLSPELFFRLEGDLLVSRPMKGTRPRGVSSGGDLLAADRLRRSPKDRAENVMIVDMVRNDLGRVAQPGTVAVSRMFDIEQYPTVWQMTSTVEARSSASIPQILAALFPPASVTGAPKIRTMEIIRELEDSPRRAYTGAIGWIAPGRRAQFSVAIRTLVVDRRAKEAVYGVGGGIVWDSDPRAEHQECLAKAAVLLRRPPAFFLLETMLREENGGIPLLQGHLARLQSSARYFGIPFDESLVRGRLTESPGEPTRHGIADTSGHSSSHTAPTAGRTDVGQRRVRLLLARDGSIAIQSIPLGPPGTDRLPRVSLAPGPVDLHDPFLYHKTTHRDVYDRVLETAGGSDDVILWNAHGEITESCIANVVVETGGALYTPPVASGLLPGVYRAHLLRAGRIRERRLTIADLHAAERIFLCNAIRGIYEVTLTG